MACPCRTTRPAVGSAVNVPVAWFTTFHEPAYPMVASTGVCETRDRRATVAVAVRYALAVAPADGEPEPLNAPPATATATPATATTPTTPAATRGPGPGGAHRRAPPRQVPAAGSPAGRPGETMPFTIRLPGRE